MLYQNITSWNDRDVILVFGLQLFYNFLQFQSFTSEPVNDNCCIPGLGIISTSCDDLGF